MNGFETRGMASDYARTMGKEDSGWLSTLRVYRVYRGHRVYRVYRVYSP